MSLKIEMNNGSLHLRDIDDCHIFINICFSGPETLDICKIFKKYIL